MLASIGMSLSLFSGAFLEREFWYDEAFTGLVVQMPWSEMWVTLQNDVHPPLYYIVLKIWGVFFGFSDLTLRGFSVFCFGLFLLAIFFFTKHFSSTKIAFFSTLFFAINPFFLQNAAEARMYPLLILLTVLSAFYFFQMLPKSFSSREDVFFAIILGLTLLTHAMAFFLALAFAIVFILSLFSQRRNWIFVVKKGIPIALIAIGMILPWWIIWFLGDMPGDPLGWMLARPFAEVPQIMATFFFGSVPGGTMIPPPPNFSPILLSSSIILPVLCILFFLLGTKRKVLFRERHISFFLLLLFLIPFLVVYFLQFFGIKLFLERYLLLFFPFFVLAFFLLFQRISSLVYFLILFVYGSSLFFVDYHFEQTSFRSLPSNPSVQAADEIVFTSPMDFTIGRFYLPEKHVLLYNEKYPEESYSKWIIIPQDLVFHDISAVSPSALFIEKNSDRKDILLQENVQNMSLFLFPRF